MLQNRRKTHHYSERARQELVYQTRRIEREIKRKMRRWMKLAEKNRMKLTEH